MRICEINFSADIVMKVFFLLSAKSLKKKVTLSSLISVILYSATGERVRYLPRYLIIPFVLLMSPSPTLKEESFVFLVKFGNSFQGLHFNFTVMIFSILNNFEDMVFPLTGNSIHIKMPHFSEVKIFSKSSQRNNGMYMWIHLRSLPKVCIIEISP